jgi:hypothetical protein
MRIFDAIIMVSDGGAIPQSSSAFLYVYVEDTDRLINAQSKQGLEK